MEHDVEKRPVHVQCIASGFAVVWRLRSVLSNGEESLRIECLRSSRLPRVSRLTTVFSCLTGGSDDTSPLFREMERSLLKRSSVSEQEIVDAITITPTENWWFLSPSNPRPRSYTVAHRAQK